MKNLSIRVKVTAGFIVVMIMLIFLVGTNAIAIKKLNDSSKLLGAFYDTIEDVEYILGEVNGAEIGGKAYVLTADTACLEPYVSAYANIYTRFETLKERTKEDSEFQNKLANLDELIDLQFDELDQVVLMHKEHGIHAARKLVLENKEKSVLPQLRSNLADLAKEQFLILEAREVRVLAALDRSQSIVTWVMIISSLIIIGLIVFVNRSIASPIKALSKKAEDISLGNLTNAFNANGRGDEIGLLVNSFNKMQTNLIHKAKQAEEMAAGNLTINVTPLSDEDVFGKSFGAMIQMFNMQMVELQQGVNVLSTASNEMMAIMSDLSSGSSQTAASVSETSATIEEIKQTTEISSKKADEVTTSSRKLASVSNEGNEAVQKSIDGMKNIKEQMESIATIVIQLSERSHKIGEIANTVNDIAEQSNLLAVNASIEAAKAGEEGKGFAVVAQEIKNLASRSKASTVEIRSILTDIQKEISGAVMATEQGGKVIDEGLEQSFKASETISALASNAEDSLQANMLISASSQQQLVGMEQITVAMESIREASNQNSNSTKQAEDSVSELTELGNRLINLLSRYKLKNS